MNSLFSSLLKTRYKRVTTPQNCRWYSLPCKPGNTFRTALIEGQEAHIEVYDGKRKKERPFLLENYLRGGYRYSEQRKKEILERVFNRPKQTPIFDAMQWLDGVICKSLKINLL